ncbi:MAG: hypothetical protein ABH867_02005 [Patescibacteria group bacterium]
MKNETTRLNPRGVTSSNPARLKSVEVESLPPSAGQTASWFSTKADNFKLLTKLLIFHFSLLTAFFSATNISAQEVSLSIFPPLVELTIRPGQTATQAFLIGNESDLDLYLRAVIVPFEPKGSRGEIELLNPKYSPAAVKYFSLVNSKIDLEQTFKLAAKSQEQLVLKAKIPENAPEQDHYLTLLLEQSPQGNFINDASGGQNLIKIGGNILLTISGSLNPKRQGTVAEFKPAPKVNDIFNSTEFKILIENTGDSFLKAEGRIKIKNLLTKKEAAALELRPDNVLANSGREIICLKQDSGEPVSYPCSFSSFIPGLYRADLSFEKNTGVEPAGLAVVFWLLPIKAGLVLIVLAIIVWQIIKKAKVFSEKN